MAVREVSLYSGNLMLGLGAKYIVSPQLKLGLSVQMPTIPMNSSGKLLYVRDRLSADCPGGDCHEDAPLISQGLEISKWAKNVYVKVPVTNSRGKFMGNVINELNKKKIKLNITAVYNAKQTKNILNKINKKTKVIISIFAGRMADSGKDPIPEFKNSIKLAKKFKNVEILWASTREPYNYLQAKKVNCHIITVPPSIIEKIEKFGRTFQKLTTDTVKTFLIDSKKSKFKISG